MNRCKILILAFGMVCGAITAQVTSAPVNYSVTGKSVVTKGETFYAEVHLNISSPWYIYAPTGVNEEQGMIESKVVWSPPAGIAKSGKLVMSDPQIKDGYDVFKGSGVLIKQPLKILSTAQSGDYEIKGKLIWQSCSDNVCLPPVRKEIKINVTVK